MTKKDFKRRIFSQSMLILASFFSFFFDSFSQPLSGIFPKYDAYSETQSNYFEWNKLDNAIDYTVLLSQDPSFSIISVQSPALSITNWTSPALSYGTWYWKVQASTGFGFEESVSNKFTVYEPSNSSSLSLWLKPDAGIVLDASNKVNLWIDQSPNGFVFNQSNSIKRPVVNPSGFNSFPTISFSGGQVLDGGDILDLGTSSRSMFVVGNMGSSNQTIFAKSVAAAAPSRYALLKDGASTAYLYTEAVNNNIYSTFNTNNIAFYALESNRTTSMERQSQQRILTRLAKKPSRYSPITSMWLILKRSENWTHNANR